MHWWGSNQTERSIFSLELDVIPMLVFRWLESAGHLSVVSVQTTAVSVVAKTVSVTGISKTVSVSVAVVSVVGISLRGGGSGGLGGGLSGPHAVVSKTVSVVAKTGVSVVSETVSVTGISKTVSVLGIGISLGLSSGSWLSISRPLAVVATTVSVMAKTGVSVVSKTVSVAPVSKTMVAQAVVAVVGIGISLGLGVGQSHGNKASKNEKLHIGCSFTEC